MTNKDKHKLYGILATVAFHAIAVVLLFNLCFRTPLPLPGEAGVEVNLGMYAEAISQQDDDILSQQDDKSTSQQVFLRRKDTETQSEGLRWRGLKAVESLKLAMSCEQFCSMLAAHYSQPLRVRDWSGILCELFQTTDNGQQITEFFE